MSEINTTNDVLTASAIYPTGAPVPAGHSSTVLAEVQRAPSSVAGISNVAGGTSLVIVLLLGFMLYRAIEKKKTKPGYVAMAFTAGVLLSGSMVGVMAQQTATSVGGGLTTMFSTVTSNGHH